MRFNECMLPLSCHIQTVLAAGSARHMYIRKVIKSQTQTNHCCITNCKPKLLKPLITAVTEKKQMKVAS